MITVNIQGHGSYIIPTEKVNELLTWLTNNSTTIESTNPIKPGDTLLNG